ncbi:MAG: C40 family peptidase [Micropruina sp.]|nr:C40 family peptidase [Micropruina sp.]
MRLRKFALSSAAVITATITLSFGAVAPPAMADPLDDAKAQLERLDKESSSIGEDYDEVKLRLADGRARVDVLKADIAAQLTKVDTLRKQATGVALAQFQNQGVSVTVQLVTSSDPDSFLQQMSTARKVDDNMNSLLQDYQAQQANLADLRRAADAEVTGMAEEEKRLSDLDASLKEKLKQSKDLVDRLTSQQLSQLSRGGARVDLSDVPVPSGGSAHAKALAAVRYAVSKVPSGQYVWGAEGPNSFDCSGLMLAAYRSVGISLPHSSRAQFGVGRAVSRSQLKAGDLVFFYSPISHVGMYMGNGMLVHARNPRNDLVIQPLSSYPEYVGARRVIG